MADHDGDPGTPPAQGRRPGTVHPHRARERALKLLYQADLRGVDPRVTLHDVLEDRVAVALLDDLDPDDATAAQPTATERPVPDRVAPLDEYTRTLVEGVADHRASIDRTIERFAHRWSVPRMPAVDRNILRLATYELLHQDTPPAVVIDEALELAHSLAGEKAGPFINGVLESVRRSLTAQEQAQGQAEPGGGAA